MHNDQLTMLRFLFLLLLLPFAACSSPATVQPTFTQTITPSPANTQAVTPTMAVTSTPQPRFTPVTYGPEIESFPNFINPLTGLTVSDPTLLELPAVLVSISNMPFSARPQAGPGFAPWIYELYIGEGATRFMNVFYGQYPRSVANITGTCDVRTENLYPAGNWIGNRIWLDENANGMQDDWEVGIGGICVRLLDANSNELLDQTATDSNGYYAFDAPNKNVLVQIAKPESYEFTAQNVGDDDRDSDVNLSGETPLIHTNSIASFWDAGLTLKPEAIATSNPSATATPWFIPTEDYVGPIRSGRLTYNQIGRMFLNSCLVYASAAWDIGEMLDACEIVFGVDQTTPNSALLPVTRLRKLAEENRNPKQPVNYSGNVFSYEIPSGGRPAKNIHIFYHAYTQSMWEYDPVSGTYLRWTDLADGTGTFIPAIDCLSQRQMAFENVIIIFAEHHRYRHNQLEIDFTMGQKSHAWLFRDGQAFKIFWSTENRAFEKKTGLIRPMHFVDGQGNPIALHPGKTWIHIVTPYSSVMEKNKGDWLVHFVQPYDPEDTPTP